MRTVGFYGKLPSHGDFLHRRVSDEFVNRWDRWLQDCLDRSREQLGSAWLDAYLTSPVWRFVLGPGVVGGGAWVGILMPSVDRAGRYFPLTVVADLPPEANPFDAADGSSRWLERVEQLALDVLDQDMPDLASFDANLQDSAGLLGGLVRPTAAMPLAMNGPDRASQWRFDLAPDLDIRSFVGTLALGLARTKLDPLAVWWSRGSDRVTPCILLTRGLPTPTSYIGLLAGKWGSDGQLFGDDAGAATARVLAIGPSPYQSAGISDVGRWRDENQDVFLERRREGLWVVADGMGGHQAGAVASQAVARHVESVGLEGDISARAKQVRAALEQANAELRARAAAESGFDAGSTVVALNLCDGRGIVQWVGDSRAYRLRRGQLVQLTHDHTVANDANGRVAEADEHAITRAIGGADTLELDWNEFEVNIGDSFMLCSDGLHQHLEPQEIGEILALPECGEATTQLVSLALQRGGRDNITVVVIHVAADTNIE